MMCLKKDLNNFTNHKKCKQVYFKYSVNLISVHLQEVAQEVRGLLFKKINQEHDIYSCTKMY